MAKDLIEDDLRALQGSWMVTSLNVEGQKLPAAMLAGSSISIKGNRFISRGMGAEYKGTIALASSTRPSQIDMKFDAGPEKGNTNRGIYELNGDTWKLCLAMRGTVRPSRFAATAGSDFALETLTRGVPTKAAKAVSNKAAESSAPGVTGVEGEWSMVSGIMNGQPMKASDVQWVRRSTRGNQTTVTAGPQVIMKVEFSSDDTTSPKMIDYINSAGANKGKRQAGIYLLEGDLLTVCTAAPGKSRPSEFQSIAGDGRSLTVWKRL